MRNSSLGRVRSLVKAETGKSLDVQATGQDAEINQLIENTQLQLATSYDFPFLKARWDSVINPGTRFQTFPNILSPQGGSPVASVAISFERPPKLEVKWNNIWQEVVYGIEETEEFNYLDSDRNAVLDPIQRWQFSDETQFEVWPLPASVAQIRFKGQRALTSLQIGSTTPPTWNDAALCDLDDLLIAYLLRLPWLRRSRVA